MPDVIDPQLLSPATIPTQTQPRAGSLGVPSRQNSGTLDNLSDGEGNTGKRRKLNLRKCRQCRDARKKCFPEDREWPDKCERCQKHRPHPLECSPPEINENKRGKNKVKPGRGAKSTSPSAKPDPEVADDSDDSLSEKDVKQEIATYERPPPTLPARKRVHAQGKEPVSEPLAFGYKDLKQDHFRLIHLAPGRGDAPLVCWLSEVSIYDKPKPDYEVVSYRWEAVSRPDAEILLQESENDINSRRPKKIKQHLGTILKTLRHPKLVKKFWLESLCLKVGNKAEMNQQRTIKKHIFYLANNLCFWLGEDLYLKAALDFISEIIKLDSIDKLVQDDNTIEKWSAFVQLLKNEVFSRLWLLHELTISQKQKVTLISSQSPIHYSDFVDAVAMFSSRRSQISSLFNRLHRGYRALDDPKIILAERFVDVTTNALRIRDVQQRSTGTESIGFGKDGRVERLLDLETLVSLLGNHKSGNSRDIIYTLLALAKDVHEYPDFRYNPKLKIDYETSTMEVYQNFVDHVLKQSKSLDILCRRWASPCPLEEPAYPSWINASNINSEAEMFVGMPDKHPYNASKPRDLVYEFTEQDENRKSLTVKGFVLDKISRLGSTSEVGRIKHEWLQLGGCSIINDLDYVPDSFWKTLVADRNDNGCNAPSWYYRAFLQCLVETPVGKDINVDEIIKLYEDSAMLIVDFLRRVQSVISGRKFLVSKDRELSGLAPPTSKPGDSICILYGCTVPVILREDKATTSWTFVGECFVYGMMDGEAVELSDKDSNLIREQQFEMR
ncbi:hypothetical protein B0O99DRAFT_673361 [Bisporella sp. PMI_857]|nr:hypothetical protein B0O99DRAFT_673361 [Bisporella sp. PMI_857]